MKYRFHGVMSVILTLTAFACANYQLYVESLFLGVIYSVWIPIMLLITVQAFCTKCPHMADNTCRHALEWIIIKLIKVKEPSKYTLWETIRATIPLCIGVIFPQYWLFNNIPVLVVFWVIMIMVVLEIRQYVCKDCQNTYCQFCPKKV